MDKNNINNLKSDLNIAMQHMLHRQELLQKLEIIFRDTFNAIDDATLIVSNLGLVEHVNLRASNYLFNQIAEIGDRFDTVIKRFIERNDFDEKDKLLKIVTETANAESFINATLVIHIKNEQEKWYEVFTSPIYDQELGHLGRVWEFRDITIRESLDRMKSEFFSIASHQLRTPLTSIRGYTDMLIEGDYGQIPSELKVPLSAIAEAGKQMSELVEEFLNLSKIEAGTLTFDVKSINPVSIIEEILKELEPQIINKKLTITTKFSFKGEILTDLTRFRESVKNVIQNAIKYSRKGHAVTVEVNKEKDHIHVTVSDQGVGIPNAEQNHIFQRFFRASNVKNEDFNGTGLGLYYVHRALSEIGATITFTSVLNKGSIFTIKLPLKFTNK